MKSIPSEHPHTSWRRCPRYDARQCGCLGDRDGRTSAVPGDLASLFGDPRARAPRIALAPVVSARARRLHPVRFFGNAAKKPRPSREMVSGGSATARRVARDVPRDARRDRFPAPALTPLVPDLAETRRRPIQEPHPRGAQRQLPLAHQRRREEGTDETLRGRSTVALPRSADLRAVSTGEIRGRRLTVALSQFPSRGFHRRWFFWLFFVSRPNDDTDRTSPNLEPRAPNTRMTNENENTKKRMNDLRRLYSSGCA